jgi:hypothetical protein
MKKFLALLLCLFCGCGETITSGTVIGKRYYPARTETYTTYTRLDIDDDGNNDIKIPHVNTIQVPENWTITFSRRVDDKDISRTVDVDKETYNDYKIGEQYPRYQAEATQ